MPSANCLMRRIAGALFICLCFYAYGPSPLAAAEAADVESLDAKTARLIGQLGAEQYATREKAQAELERLGLVAFDALHEAQNHDDIEIALRARYLVRSMRVTWSRDDDPAEVKKILRDYGGQQESERRTRMDRLAALDGLQGADALCRLVRFESSEELSKRAALRLMNLTAPPEEKSKSEMAQMIRSTVGQSKRTASEWLKAYAHTLENAQGSLAEWDRLTRAEQDTYAQFPETQSTREIVRDLLRWQAALLERLNRAAEAVAVMRRSIELLDGSREELFDAVDWLMARGAWSVVNEVARRYNTTFQEEPLLVYRLAESQLQQGQNELAAATAQRALKLTPDEPDAHIRVAYALQESGFQQWSELEYRDVIQRGPAGSPTELLARLLLSDMLHDLQQDLPAAEVLQGLVDAMDKDPSIEQRLQQPPLSRQPGGIKSRMHYFYAEHFARAGDHAQQIKHFEQGIQADPLDADLLIAMYRAKEAEPAFRKQTLKRIQSAADHFRGEINKLVQLAAQAANEPTRENYRFRLATANNQFAWLIGNTEGNYDEALRASQKSLEIRPDDGGLLDTLARCYFAKGDLENAVKCQARAAELEPHQLQIRRQLQLFQKTLAESQKAATPGGN